MTATLLPAIQTLLADHGWGQYPLPRRYVRGRESHPMPMGARILLGIFCAFWIVVLGGVAFAMAWAAGTFAVALFTA